jgi:hypothetical protein
MLKVSKTIVLKVQNFVKDKKIYGNIFIFNMPSANLMNYSTNMCCIGLVLSTIDFVHKILTLSPTLW